MARHKEKDDEAGGEGLGVLATRKRLWRDAEGNIVNARRPSYTQEGAKRRQIARPDRRPSTTIIKEESMASAHSILPACLPSPSSMSRAGSASSTIIVDTGSETYSPSREEEEEEEQLKFEQEMRNPQDSWLDMNLHAHTLPSPPTSSCSPNSNSEAHSPVSPAADLSELDALYEDAWSPLALAQPHDGLPQLSMPGSMSSSISRSGSGSGSETPSSAHSSPYFGSASWADPSPAQTEAQSFQTFMGAMAELPYEDVMFKPEPGSGAEMGMGMGMGMGLGLYEWQQAWNGGSGSGGQMLMSRCREEKYDPVGAEAGRKLEWGGLGGSNSGVGAGSGGGSSSMYLGQESFRRAFGLGTC